MPNTSRKKRVPKPPPRNLPLLSDNTNDWKKLPPLCNGEQTGFQCKHYWVIVTATNAVRAFDEKEKMRHTIKRERLCRVNKPDTDNFGEAGIAQALVCSLYQKSRFPYAKDFEEASSKRNDEDMQDVEVAPPNPEQIVTVQIEKLKSDAKERIINGHLATSVFPAPKDWDAEPDAPPNGYVHLRIPSDRMACGMLLEREMPCRPGERPEIVSRQRMEMNLPQTGPGEANDLLAVLTCPGCVQFVQDDRERAEVLRGALIPNNTPPEEA